MSKDAFDTKDIFYTDSNSLEFMKRTTVKKPPSDIVQTSPSNFYPITSGIWCEAGQQQFIVMPSYSAGGSGQTQGRIELMIDRQMKLSILDTINGEALDEPGPPRAFVTYTFAWTHSRAELFDIHRETYLETLNPLYMQVSTKVTKLPCSTATKTCASNFLKEALYEYQVNELYLTMISPNQIDMTISHLSCHICPRKIAAALCRFAQQERDTFSGINCKCGIDVKEVKLQGVCGETNCCKKLQKFRITIDSSHKEEEEHECREHEEKECRYQDKGECQEEVRHKTY